MESRPRPVEQEWKRAYEGTTYVINMTVNEFMLALELENAETGERWSGEFTAGTIESLTHKSGSVKNLATFAKMIAHAFSGDSEKVSAEVLTYTGILERKARSERQPVEAYKATAQQDPQRAASFRKRYVILAYRGDEDFDSKQIFYPLPLEFEESPNFPALKRTIARLRNQIADLENREHEPRTEKEHELRSIVARLRQENTELKHRLRQGGHVLNTSTASALNASVSALGLNSEISATNAKLRRENEQLQKQLQEAAQLLDAERTRARKEIAKWQEKIGGPASTSPGRFAAAAHQAQVSELRRTVAELEKQLRYERLHRGANANPNSGWSPSTRRAVAQSDAGWQRTRSTSSSRGGSAEPRRSTSSSGRPVSAPDGVVGRSAGIAGRSVSPIVRPSSAPRSREVTPSARQRTTEYGGYGGYTPGSGSRRSSPALATSLGGRFDPTAYQQDRALRLQNAQRNRAWGAGATASPASGGGRHRYSSPHGGESGYTSANSQSSRGSRRSQRSVGSDRSLQHGYSSAGSQDSQGRKRKSSKKKASAGEGIAGRTTQGRTRRHSAPPAEAQRSTRSAEKSREIGRINGKVRRDDVPAASAAPAPAAAVKPSHRRSRESPHGDSETDDSDFAAPRRHSHTAAERTSHQSQEARKHASDEVKETRGSAEGRRTAPAGTALTPGKATAYNTFLNAVGNAPVNTSTESRRSQDRLVALAQQRSSYLVRDDDRVEKDGERRRSAGDRSVEIERAAVEQALRGSVESHRSAASLSTAASAPSVSQSASRPASLQASISSAAGLRASHERERADAPAAAARADIASPGRSRRASASTAAAAAAPSKAEDFEELPPPSDMEEMDKRIRALQMYLDKARSAL